VLNYIYAVNEEEMENELVVKWHYLTLNGLFDPHTLNILAIDFKHKLPNGAMFGQLYTSKKQIFTLDMPSRA